MVPVPPKWRRPLPVAAVALAGLSFVWLVAWPWFRDRYAPNYSTSSICRVCGCMRHASKIQSRPKAEAVEPTACSLWVDSFLPPHEHAWGSGSSSERSEWFGATLFACGGNEAIHTIHRLRGKLGEADARRLATRWLELVNQPLQGNERDAALDRFASALHDDPEKLLNDEFGVTTLRDVIVIPEIESRVVR